MNFSVATKKQLLQIAMHEDCELDIKYAACRELQRRGKSRFPETIDYYTPREERIL